MFLDTPLSPIREVAKAILRLSDFYIQNPKAETPWHEEYCQLAYRHYYLPLNALRCELVIERGQQVGFFADLNYFIDWGSGPGTASLALARSTLRPQIKSQTLYDISDQVLARFSDLHKNLVHPKVEKKLNLQHLSQPEKTCLIFSYSLTELSQLPSGWNQAEALMILEPSTSEDGRRLMQLRETLMRNGFHIWAPCTHRLSCPLLLHSKQDWCHDRIHVQSPEWFDELEQYLPMKNKTVTTSYLLARKKAPSPLSERAVRLVGDSLPEKGKTRQLICRGPEREFISWLHKQTQAQIMPRGVLIELPEIFEKKSNEIRLTEPCQLLSALAHSSPQC